MTQFRNDIEREIIELWIGGMPMTNIWHHLHGRAGIDRVRITVATFCDRDIHYSKDGRSWGYRLARRVHASAPLSAADRRELWPMPFDPLCGDPMPEDETAALRKAVFDAADALNELLETIAHGAPGWPLRHFPQMPVISLDGGRIRIAFDSEDRVTGDEPLPAHRGTP